MNYHHQRHHSTWTYTSWHVQFTCWRAMIVHKHDLNMTKLQRLKSYSASTSSNHEYTVTFGYQNGEITQKIANPNQFCGPPCDLLVVPLLSFARYNIASVVSMKGPVPSITEYIIKSFLIGQRSCCCGRDVLFWKIWGLPRDSSILFIGMITFKCEINWRFQ